MAASSSSAKSSPSDKPLDEAARSEKTQESTTVPESTAVDEAPSSPSATPTTATPQASSTSTPVVVVDKSTNGLPTYESVKHGQRYIVAKTLLANGDFEDAMMTIEEGLEEVREELLASGSVTEDMVGFHPAIGPYHYLYGSTLLYSIEESSDDQQPVTTAEPNSAAPEEGGFQEDVPEDDTQIAFENLDIARVIVEQYLISIENNYKSDDAQNTENEKSSVDGLRLDLAQTRLREGDLNRLRGHNEMALADYQECLNLRMAVVESKDSNLLGPYDRKLAEVHNCLGLTYALIVAESQSSKDEPPSMTNPLVAAAVPAAAAEQSGPAVLDPQQLEKYRRASAFHYLQVGRNMCARLALFARQDVDEFFQKVQAAMPSFKTTGEDGHDDDESSSSSGMPPALARLQLRTMREQADRLPTLDSADAPEIAALKELLEEIQETMDEAEASEEGIHQVAHMKAAITAAAAAVGAEQGEAPASSFSLSTNAFGSQAAAAVTAAAQPIMAVRKKKRPPTEAAKENPSKQPKPSSE